MYAVVHTPTLDPPNTRGRGRSATSLGWRVMTSQPTIPAGLSAGTVPDAADEPAEEVDLATETPQDISTRVQDGEDFPVGIEPVDVNVLINHIRPVALSPTAGGTIPCPDPTRCDDTRFFDVTPGDDVEFSVEFQNDTVEPIATAQIFRATIYVVGNGVADLDAREVVIVVPAGSVPFLE